MYLWSLNPLICWTKDLNDSWNSIVICIDISRHQLLYIQHGNGLQDVSYTSLYTSQIQTSNNTFPLLLLLKEFRKLTLSLLGYLETRICWGGVNLAPPPSKSHVWCPNTTNDTSLERSCALLLESAKKFANLQKLNFLSQNPVSKNVCKKKIVQKMINYTFLKSPWPCHFKYAKSFAKF